MYIHLGGEKVIRYSELIAIFDIAVDEHSKITKHFLSRIEENRQLERVSEEEPKSLVVTDHKVYYSPISAATLKKRAQFVFQ